MNDMKIDDYILLEEKAKTKKDGVYSWHGYMYVVKNNRFIAYADNYGECFSCHGAFTVSIGKIEKHDRKKKLTEYLEKLLKSPNS
jgi:hypothetical protein